MEHDASAKRYDLACTMIFQYVQLARHATFNARQRRYISFATRKAILSNASSPLLELSLLRVHLRVELEKLMFNILNIHGDIRLL